MLRVNYQIEFGEVCGHNIDGSKWKVKYHPANCDLGAFICHTKNEKGEKVAVLWTFLDDAQHVKNIMKDSSDHKLFGDSVDKVKLNVYYKQARAIIEACAKSGYKVSCYYKEPKKSKNVAV